ncbi:MAG: hypothetical protein ACREP4_07600 [Stenotrophomonas sp.]|uniref:hypothetical protein n=1 Tax=Stenotrophomonas sp. TaxID=69392 RepID=UPI003D6D78E3
MPLAAYKDNHLPLAGCPMPPPPSPLSAGDLLHPTIAALVSVIVNYGDTFVLVFQAARVAGLGPELTASWVWSVSTDAAVNR